MKALGLTLALPASLFAVGAAITTSVVYAAALVVVLALVLLFVLVFRREIAVHVEWGKEEKRIWFERIPRRRE